MSASRGIIRRTFARNSALDNLKQIAPDTNMAIPDQNAIWPQNSEKCCNPYQKAFQIPAASKRSPRPITRGRENLRTNAMPSAPITKHTAITVPIGIMLQAPTNWFEYITRSYVKTHTLWEQVPLKWWEQSVWSALTTVWCLISCLYKSLWKKQNFTFTPKFYSK